MAERSWDTERSHCWCENSCLEFRKPTVRVRVTSFRLIRKGILLSELRSLQKSLSMSLSAMVKGGSD